MDQDAALSIAIVSFLVSAVAVIANFKHVRIAEDALQSQCQNSEKSARLQALIQIRSSSMGGDYSDGIELIGLIESKNFEDFDKRFGRDDKRKIRDCVEHLNFVANLVLGKHIGPQDAWDIYFMSYRLLGQRLNPWWFDAMAVAHPNRFSATRTMINRVMKYTDEDIAAFDLKRNKLNGI